MALISEPNLDVFLQSRVHVDGLLLYVVDDGAVGDVVVLAGSSGPTVEEEDEDDHQWHEAGPADKGKDGGHVTLNTQNTLYIHCHCSYHLSCVKIIKADEDGLPGGQAGTHGAGRDPLHVHHHIEVLVNNGHPGL